MATSPKNCNDTESENCENVITGKKHRYFSMLPNLIDAMGLSVYAHRLYTHINTVVGWSSSDTCTESSRTIGEICQMSLGSVTNAKKELEERNLIEVKTYTNPETKHKQCKITITDTWPQNYAYQSVNFLVEKAAQKSVCSPHEQTCSSCEHTRSCGVLKKEELKTLLRVNPVDKILEPLQEMQKILQPEEEQKKQKSSSLPKETGVSQETNPQIGVQSRTFIDYEKMIQDCPTDLSKHDAVDWFYQHLQYTLGDKAYEQAVELYRQREGEVVREKRDADTQRERYIQSMNNGAVTKEQVEGELCTVFDMEYSFVGKYTQQRLRKLVERVKRGETVEQFKQWWTTSDWRGKGGQAPTLENIFTYWPQAFKSSVVQAKVTLATDGGAYV